MYLPFQTRLRACQAVRITVMFSTIDWVFRFGLPLIGLFAACPFCHSLMYALITFTFPYPCTVVPRIGHVRVKNLPLVPTLHISLLRRSVCGRFFQQLKRLRVLANPNYSLAVYFVFRFIYFSSRKTSIFNASTPFLSVLNIKFFGEFLPVNSP